MTRSLKTRLALWLLISLGLLLVVMSVVIFLLQRTLLIQDFDRELRSSMTPEVFMQLERIEFKKEKPVGDPIAGLDAYCIRDEDTAQILVCYPETSFPFPEEINPLGEKNRFFFFRFPDGTAGRACVEQMQGKKRGPPPRRRPGPGPGFDDRFHDRFEKPPLSMPASAPLSIFVASSAEKLYSQLRLRAVIMTASALLGILFVTMIVLYVISRSLKPLHLLGRQIASLDPERLNQRLEVPGLPSEILPVVQQFNTLLVRLEAAFQREKNFANDAAHELRTPIAGIRSELEVTLTRPRDNTQYIQALQKSLSSITALQNLTERLLELTRLEENSVAQNTATIHIREKVLRQWQNFSDDADARKLTLTAAIPGDLTFTADPVLFERVVDNLLSNAVHYAEPAGTITVEGERNRDCINLRFINPVQELTPTDLPLLFDRFWRKDPARTLGGGNYGLGLTVVKRAVEHMGGSVAARLDGNLTIELLFKEQGAGQNGG